MTLNDYEIDSELMQLRAKKRKRKIFIELGVWCICVWAVMNLLFGVAVVEGNSMRPAFLPGDLVIYRRNIHAEPDYNDVVIVSLPIREEIIKRIVGKPGDVIDVDEKGHLTRNGEPVREPEILFGYQDADMHTEFPYTVPEGTYFYMGDNRPVSLDSRILGVAEKKNVKGTVIGVLRFGRWNKKTR